MKLLSLSRIFRPLLLLYPLLWRFLPGYKKLPIVLQKGLAIILSISILLTGTGILYIFNPFVSKTQAAWFDDSWGYRQRIPIDTHTASETDVYNAISVDTATLTTDKLQADCDDLRFTKENGEVLPYQIVSGCDSATTVINVGFDTMPIAPFNIYMYYGNPTATIGSTTLTHAACGNGCAEGTAATEEKGTAPVGYWRFDEGTGTNTNDSTPNNLDGTLTNTPTWTTEDRCISSKCLEFDGSTEYVTVADNASLDITGDITLSAWIRPNIVSGTQVIAVKGGSNWGFVNYEFYLSGDELVFRWYNAGFETHTTSGVDLTANKWYQVSAVISSSTIIIYVDGIQRLSETATAARVADARTVTIGADPNDGATYSNFFNGFIDEVKIYNFALSAAQIKANYNAKASGDGASVILGSSATPGSTLSNGLVGYWKMDESSWTNDCSTATLTDSSGNGKSGIACPATTGPTGAVVGKFGNAGDFDGSDDYVSIASPGLPTGDFSYSAWSYPDATSDEVLFMAADGNGGNEFLIAYNTTNRIQVVINGSVALTSTGTLNTTSWQHITATRSGSTVRLFINGAQDASTGTDSTTLSFSTCALLVGVDADATCTGTLGNWMDGKIDEARVYNRALSPAEVSQLYNFAPGPVGYWELNEGSGSSATDKSGNSYTGTITGATYTNGKYGKALNFDATNDGFTTSDMGSFSSYTAEAWVKLNTTEEYDNIFYWVSTGSYISLESGVCFYTASWSCTSSTIPVGTWMHVAVTSDGKAYLNGVLQGTITVETVTGVPEIGNRDGTGSDFGGQIDEVKIYNYSRSGKQIVEDMNAGHPAPGSPVGSAVGYWRFDEGADNTCSGGVKDACNSGSGGSTYDGTSTGSPTWTQSGKFGRAINFSPTDGDYVSGTAGFATAAGTVSVWFKQESTGAAANYVIAHTSGANGNRVYFGTTSASSVFVCRLMSGTTIGNSYTVSLDTWYHAACSWDGTGAKYYINGVQQGATTTITAFDSIGTMAVGAFTDGTQDFDGDIDEVKTYNFALTADEIKLDMNRGQAQILGATSDNSSYQKQAANQEYCVPGDSTSCVAPVGRWDLNEGTGTSAFDQSGSGYTGTLTNTPTWTTGKTGKALGFNGSSNQYVTTSSNIFDPSATSFTAEAWFNTNSVSTTQSIITQGDGTGTGRAWLYVDSTGVIASFLGNSATLGTTALAVNTWYHATVTKTGTTVAVYLNGRLETTATRTTEAATGNSIIGLHKDLSTQDFNGKIDQVRIFADDRSAAQIAWDYNRGAPVGWWRFDECQGTTAYDSTGNSNSGTITIGGTGTYTTAGTCSSGTATHAWAGGVAGAGKRNYALSFDYTDDYVTVADSASLDLSGDLTVAAWIYSTDITQTQHILSKRTACGAANYQLHLSSSALGFYSSTSVNSATVLSSNTWYHVVASVTSAGAVTLYINGKLDTTGSATLGGANNGTFRIGHAESCTQYFKGQIDDVRVYNYALTATQVKQLYNGFATFYGPVTGAP